MQPLKVCSLFLLLTTLAACSTIGHAPPTPAPLTETKLVKQRPNLALLQVCNSLPQIETHTVGDIQMNRELAITAYKDCAARMCRLVQWFLPETVCAPHADTSTKAQSPAEAGSAPAPASSS